MSFLRKSSLILEGNLNQLLIEPTFDYNIPAYSKYPFMEIDLPILTMIYLTQYASKKDHLRNIKITKFQNLFREAWGCWQDPLHPKNFGTGRPIQLILSAIFGYFSNFGLQKKPHKMFSFDHFFASGWSIGVSRVHKRKISQRILTQSE